MTPVLPRVSYAAVVAGARPSAVSGSGASTGSTAPTSTALGATATAPSPTPQTSIAPNSAALPGFNATADSTRKPTWPSCQPEDTAYWERYNASWVPREPDDFSSFSSSSSPATTPSTSPTSPTSPISSASSSPPTRESPSSSPSTVIWTRPAADTAGKFAKIRGYRTVYVASLASCASASEFKDVIDPGLDDACRDGARFTLGLHHEMFDHCMEQLRRRQVPAELVAVYYGRDNDGPKRRALERQGYRVKYIKGDGERVDEVLMADSETMI